MVKGQSPDANGETHLPSHRLCGNQTRDRLPININTEKKIEYSGFVIATLSSNILPSAEGDNLSELARTRNLPGLVRVLDEFKQVKSSRLIRSLPTDEILKLEKKAASTNFPPLHSLASYWRLDCRALIEEEVEKFVRLLKQLPEINLAYREMAVSDPMPVNASDDPLSSSQDYLDAAPTGIDALWAWTQPNGDGSGVGFIDLEQGWFPNHVDLVAKTPTLIFNDNHDGVGAYKGNHGTAVLGEVVGVDNILGIVGIAANCTSVRMVSHYNAATDTALHVADAVVASIAAMSVGDVLLLEVQRGSLLLPTETDPADFDAIRLAVANGMIVVEAGGNGANNLDTWTNSIGQTILNRVSPQFRDSGAIMVGASVSAVPHDRASFSNFGSRIDCYGWGENITTCGYGDLSPGAPDNSTYTAAFGGTSGASPIITGAAIILQGMYNATTGVRLSPGQMRALLSNPATGTPQGSGISGNIGVMPNLRAIIENTLGLVPDIYLRDYVGDTGSIPSSGPISASPDVIVLPSVVANPAASFGEGSGTENSDILGSLVEAGQDNFIYIRMRNRGLAQANNVTATAYWSQVSTLVTPDMWTLIGTSAPLNVPVGDTLVVTNPGITWNSGAIPATGHYCFIALLNQLQDPTPPIPPATDWNGFRSFIRNHNNVTWRNFNIENNLPDPSADPISEPFLVSGAPDKTRVFDLEIQQRLPEDVRVWLQIPYELYAALPKDLLVKVDIKHEAVMILLPRSRSVPLCNVRLGRSSHHNCRFVIAGSKGFENGTHYISIRQVFEGEEVGRITWALRKMRKTLNK